MVVTSAAHNCDLKSHLGTAAAGSPARYGGAYHPPTLPRKLACYRGIPRSSFCCSSFTGHCVVNCPSSPDCPCLKFGRWNSDGLADGKCERCAREGAPTAERNALWGRDQCSLSRHSVQSERRVCEARVAVAVAAAVAVCSPLLLTDGLDTSSNSLWKTSREGSLLCAAGEASLHVPAAWGC